MSAEHHGRPDDPRKSYRPRFFVPLAAILITAFVALMIVFFVISD